MRSPITALLLACTLTACPKKTPDKPDPKPVIDAGVEVGSNAPAVDAAAPKVDPMCANRPEKAGPFVLDAALAAQRRGTNAKTYVDADSSRDRPVEVCGLEGARLWLEKTKCPDGKPSQNEGRVGSAGLGGRCNTMIERYKVGCSEGSINIYLAVHFCGPGEAM
jgi:hypothetical protein